MKRQRLCESCEECPKYDTGLGPCPCPCHDDDDLDHDGLYDADELGLDPEEDDDRA